MCVYGLTVYIALVSAIRKKLLARAVSAWLPYHTQCEEYTHILLGLMLRIVTASPGMRTIAIICVFVCGAFPIFISCSSSMCTYICAELCLQRTQLG